VTILLAEKQRQGYQSAQKFGPKGEGVRTGAPIRTVLFFSLILATSAHAQTANPQQAPAPGPQNQSQSPAANPPTQVVIRTPTGPCVQPAPAVRWEDYEGPFAKFVGIFGRKLEFRSVHAPHYKPGAVLCTLTVKDKFFFFLEDSVQPANFLTAGFNAGIGQAEDDDPSYGQGAAGYGKRFGASLADQASGEFFKDFVYPTIFSEDPRYYRMAHGSTGRRFLHAVEHSVIAYRDKDGSKMFNFSEWLGTASAVVLANTYHFDNRRGAGPAAERLSISVGSDAGFDILREFWPEIARKFKLPFRDQGEPLR